MALTPLTVTCPTCSADVDEYCQNDDGSPMTNRVHINRVYAERRAHTHDEPKLCGVCGAYWKCDCEPAPDPYEDLTNAYMANGLSFQAARRQAKQSLFYQVYGGRV